MLTHIDQNNLPTMVDVTKKGTSVRMAEAETTIVLPEIFRKYFVGEELVLKKGPVFQTAIIAGTMAVKKTYEMIPFCHQIPVESCKFKITMKDLTVIIACTVKTTFKTGVEMEALHGAMVAALTVYDMCKALSHDMIIQETKLIQKTGGKRTLLSRPLYGLVLTGGKSKRMNEDKALIQYKNKPHAEYIHDVLSKFCSHVYLSQKPNQWVGTPLEHLSKIDDKYEGVIGGILSAMEQHPEANWLIVACDLVHFNEKIVEKILSENSEKLATCFKNSEKDFPEPLCALYTPMIREHFLKAYNEGITCPVKVLKSLDLTLLNQEEGISLMNINTPEERNEFH